VASGTQNYLPRKLTLLVILDDRQQTPNWPSPPVFPITDLRYLFSVRSFASHIAPRVGACFHGYQSLTLRLRFSFMHIIDCSPVGSIYQSINQYFLIEKK